MLKKEIRDILKRARPHGWVMEPDAKRILALSGIAVPRFKLAQRKETAVEFAGQIGYPVVAKIVSPAVMHKSEVDGVKVGIQDAQELESVYARFCRFKGFAGMLVEEQLSGIEMIIGGKIDVQFGPVVLLGIGGTGVEVYKDTVLRMAPVTADDVQSMVGCLTAGCLLQGFRGQQAIDMQALNELMIHFSVLLVRMADFVSSVDLNPVLCTDRGCTVADARILLKAEPV